MSHTPTSPHNQTLLLSKRISTFLHSNLSPHLHTLLLLTPNGKLLSTSSSSPASVLRHQGTLALSLWTLYSPFPSSTVNASLPISNQDTNGAAEGPGQSEKETKSILIQMEFGIMTIRKLACGLLFVAIGNGSGSSTGVSTPQLESMPGSPGREEGSETGSVRSAGGAALQAGKGIMGMRRQAEEIGKLLEGKLEGLVLCEWDAR